MVLAQRRNVIEYNQRVSEKNFLLTLSASNSQIDVLGQGMKGKVSLNLGFSDL